jgi:hypothetical protein
VKKLREKLRCQSKDPVNVAIPGADVFTIYNFTKERSEGCSHTYDPPSTWTRGPKNFFLEKITQEKTVRKICVGSDKDIYNRNNNDCNSHPIGVLVMLGCYSCDGAYT